MSEFLQRASHRMHFRVDGPQNAPALVFSNSLGTDLHMWDAQAEALAEDFRVIRYDRRGHGASTAAQAPFTIGDLGGDVLALLDHLNVERAHFCGLSIGGLVGQWLGIYAADRLATLTVCATAARIGTTESWHERAELVRREGLGVLWDATVERWFGPSYVAAHGSVIDRLGDTFVRGSAQGYAQCCEALAQADFRDDLAKIAVPVLCVSGDDDPVCTPADLLHIASSVAHGRHVSVPGRHICNIESAPAFNAALVQFAK